MPFVREEDSEALTVMLIDLYRDLDVVFSSDPLDDEWMLSAGIVQMDLKRIKGEIETMGAEAFEGPNEERLDAYYQSKRYIEGIVPVATHRSVLSRQLSTNNSQTPFTD